MQELTAKMKLYAFSLQIIPRGAERINEFVNLKKFNLRFKPSGSILFAYCEGRADFPHPTFEGRGRACQKGAEP